MEVKINKEIRDYKETIFFGLSMRQCIFSLCACAVAVILYFLLKQYVALEILSWVCILGAIPFAVLGFVKYNGMNAEEFIWAWLKSEVLMPKVLLFEPENIYYEMLKPEYEKYEKEVMKIENTKTIEKRNRKRKNKNTKDSTTSDTDKSNIRRWRISSR